MMRKFCYLMVMGLISACHSPSKHKPGDTSEASYNRYASGFNVDAYDTFSLLHVYNPWQNSQGVSFSYVLAEDPSLVPDTLRDLVYIQTPVSRVITLSTTHVAMIDQLGEQESIKGVSGTGFIYNEEMRERISTRDVIDVGYDQGLSYEQFGSLWC